MIFIATCIRNEKPSGVWLIVLSYLPLNDVIETSSVCKWFFGLSRKISFFNKNLEHSRLFFNNSRVIFDCYEISCLPFYGHLRFCLEKYVRDEDYFMKSKKNKMTKVLTSILPFCV